MTYPVGQPEGGASGAYVVGTVDDAQGQSEASVRALIRSKNLAGFGSAQSGFGDIFSGFLQMFAQMNAIIDEQVTQAGEITDDLTELSNRVDLLEGGAVTVRTYVFNSTWTKPPGLIRLGVAVEGGGSAGRTGSTVAANIGGTGGLSGGYRFQWFEAEAIINDIGATETITIGAGGNTPSQLGGVSRYGNHISSVPGVGAVLSVEGATLSNSAAGSGGQGGNGANDNTGVALSGGRAGDGSAFGSGGAGGATGGNRNGGNGSAATISPVTRGNGGSGGGGGGTNAAFQNAGAGGSGGFPSGAGGGGGGRSAFSTSDGAGGLGADGRVTLIEYTSG